MLQACILLVYMRAAHTWLLMTRVWCTPAARGQACCCWRQQCCLRQTCGQRGSSWCSLPVTGALVEEVHQLPGPLGLFVEVSILPPHSLLILPPSHYPQKLFHFRCVLSFFHLHLQRVQAPEGLQLQLVRADAEQITALKEQQRQRRLQSIHEAAGGALAVQHAPGHQAAAAVCLIWSLLQRQHVYSHAACSETCTGTCIGSMIPVFSRALPDSLT